MTLAENGHPFRFVPHAEVEALYGDEDEIVVGVIVEDHCLGLELPQFGIQVWVEESDFDQEDANDEAIRIMLARLLAFYSALRELPPSYVHEVENAQRSLIERELLPWYGAMLGKNPAYVTLPAENGVVLEKRSVPA